MGALMAFPQLALPNTSGPLAQVCKEIARVLGVILDKPHLDSQIVSNVFVKAGGVVRVAHGLSRPLATWKVVRQNANAVLWEDTTPSVIVSPEKFLYLHSSADVTVSLEVA
jgi:hypothetical protein